MTSDQNIAYRLVPKCACSTIGQILFHYSNGHFYDGDIHDVQTGIHKWALTESQPIISHKVRTRQCYVFSCVRNPYTRILSCFFDKIMGTQRDGKRYRGDIQHHAIPRYGIDLDTLDQIQAFRRFLLMARDTILWKHPLKPDLHWVSVSSHIGALIKSGGYYNHIFHMEAFDKGMQKVFKDTNMLGNPEKEISEVPRFNESSTHGPRRLYPVEDYFDDLSHHIMWEIYQLDFELFRYSFGNPTNNQPNDDLDLDEIHAKLGSSF